MRTINAQQIKNMFFNFLNAFSIEERVEVKCNKSSKYKIDGLSDKEIEDLVTFICIKIFWCLKEVIEKKEWNEFFDVSDKILEKLSKKTIFIFMTSSFKERSSHFFKIKNNDCQKIKKVNSSKRVNDKLKKILFNDESVNNPYVIKFSNLKNIFENSQIVSNIFRKIGISIDILKQNYNILVKIIKIGIKHK